MTRIYSQLATLLTCTLIFTGCTHTIPVVSHAPLCIEKDELLTQECASPRPVADGTTFNGLVETMKSDRDALQKCQLSQAKLRTAINICNQQASDFNKQIDILNEKNKKDAK